MYSAGELERASMALDEPMYGLEHRIMTDIVRRIRENGEITAAADWQITRLIQLGMAMEEITAAINEALGAAEGITDNLFSNIIEAGYARDNNLYKAIGKVQIPFNENAPLQQMISAVTAQTNETMHNITQSLGFAQRGADGRISFTPIADYYQKTLDNAMLDISSGAFDYNTVLNRTVKEMTNSGLRTVDYATGWSNRVPVAARRAVMTGMNQLTAKKNEQDAEELHTNWFEISWHSGARPSHWWGGRQYTKEQLTTICNLGDVTGLCGANCYHNYHPFIPGISIPVYTEEELEELNRQEKEPIEWNGKKYTKYEATQRQRQLETTMRAQREEMALLEEGGADEDDLINCRARYHGTSHEYAQFSKAMGLPQERERVYADGLGTKLMQGKTEGGSGKESPVKVPAVGAHVTDTVTAEERKELLTRKKKDDIIVTKKDVENLTSTMPNDDDADEFVSLLNNCRNEDIKRAYRDYTEQLDTAIYNPKHGGASYYRKTQNKLVYSYPTDDDIINGDTKYSTITHEYGHFIDAKGIFNNLSFAESDALNSSIGTSFVFKRSPSGSDQFLDALRKDKSALAKVVMKKEFRDDIFSTVASGSVQDALDGMFGSKVKMKIGHGEEYYNERYNNLKKFGQEKKIQSALKQLGFDASNQAKVKSLVRNHETASELWANIMSAETCGGADLEYIKMYLPNSYSTFVSIMKGLR